MDTSSTGKRRHGPNRGTNITRTPEISQPSSDTKIDPRTSTSEFPELSNTQEFRHHSQTGAFQLTPGLRNAPSRSSATGVRTSERSRKLKDFSKLKTRAECANYCEQNPSVWLENADDLRTLAIEALHQKQNADAKRIAERWLMLSRAHRMELTKEQACDWLFRVDEQSKSTLGLDQDLADLMVVLTNAAEGPKPASSSMRPMAAANSEIPLRSNVRSSPSADIAIDPRSSNSSVLEPDRAFTATSLSSLPYQSEDFGTLRDPGTRSFSTGTNMMIGSLPNAYAAQESSPSSPHDARALLMRDANRGLNRDDSVFQPRDSSLSSPPQLIRHSTDNRYSLDQSMAETGSNLLSDVNSIEIMTLHGDVPEIESETEGLGPKPRYLAGLDPERTDELRRSFYVRKGKEAKGFFVKGRVFGMVWHENAGTTRGANNRTVWRGPNQTAVSHKLEKPFHTYTVTKDGVRVFSHIRRFVIVKARSAYCWAIPINSYGGHGLLRKNMSERERNAHTIIYDISKGWQRVQGEPELSKTPIAVNMAAGETLTHASRLHFDKPQSIDWNIKVKDIGMITGPIHLRNLIIYFQTEFKLEEETTVSAGGR